MVLGEVAAGAAAGAHALWGYNRENYLFDRKMRQETEMKLLEWRSVQAELWRDDVREIIGLTEKKMDTYLIVGTLQLGMCLGLFSEGRLEPGTPPWLLHFYMLTLGGAFMYLLMCAWMAMHASIVASCSSVRLLTQFVRLPVPTWEQLEEMRTYAQTYENIHVSSMLRVPFTQAAPTRGTNDPWGKEQHGLDRELEELQAKPAAVRRHIGLARKAAAQYQCYDAFARVAMSFGTNQLLNAIAYYCLGYVAVQDGALWPAWCIVAIMMSVAVAMVHLDLSMTRREQLLAQILILSGPTCCSAAVCLWTVHGPHYEALMMVFLPLAYAAHGMWLFLGMSLCGTEMQKNGAELPMKFRAVLYLDVFGWLSQRNEKRRTKFESRSYMELPQGVPPNGHEEERRTLRQNDGDGAKSSNREALQQQHRELQEDLALWRSDKAQRAMDAQERDRVERVAQKVDVAPVLEGGNAASSSAPRGRAATSTSDCGSRREHRPYLKLRSYTDFGVEVPYYLHTESGEVHMSPLDDVPKRHVRTLSELEEGLESYCTAVSGLPESPTGGSSPVQDRQSMGQKVQAAKRATFGRCTDVPEEEEEELEVKGGPVRSKSLRSEKSRGFTKSLTSLPQVTHTIDQPPEAFAAPRQLDDVPEHAFEAATYTPGHNEAGKDDEQAEHVTGHDKLQPGRVPAKVFRMGTLMMVCLWAIGLTLPLGVFRNFMTKPLTAKIFVEEIEENMPGGGKRTKTREVEAVVGTAPNGLPQLIPEYHSIERMPDLPEGHLINVGWPSHSGFLPRSLSCDPHGKQLVVADDLGVYSGMLLPEEKVVMGRQLQEGRGPQEPGPMTGMSMGTVHSGPPHSVRFERVPPCAALEGQALKDVSVICPPDIDGVLGERQEGCRVVVLHAQGKRIAECPLVGVGSNRADQPGAVSVARGDEAPRGESWTISTDWLHHHQQRHEFVESVAVNSECLSNEGFDTSALRAENVGCVVVGTTSGRIVQLRGAFSGERRLVPERAMQQRVQSIVRGSLHVFSNGLVMALHHHSGSLQAFDSEKGTAVGEWRLPKGVRWLTLCAGGDSIFALGLRNKTSVELHRFPVPATLKDVQASLNRRKFWRLGLVVNQETRGQEI